MEHIPSAQTDRENHKNRYGYADAKSNPRVRIWDAQVCLTLRARKYFVETNDLHVLQFSPASRANRKRSMQQSSVSRHDFSVCCLRPNSAL